MYHIRVAYSRRVRLIIQALRGDRSARERIFGSLRYHFGTSRVVGHVLRALLKNGPLDTGGLADWLARFDSPSIEILNCLSATTSSVPNVRFVLYVVPGTIKWVLRTRQSLEHIIGLNWSGIVLVSPSCSSMDVADIQKAFSGDERFSFEWPRDEGMPTLLLQAGVIPRAHGPRVLMEALLSTPNAMIAYADECRMDDAGVVFDPWFKPEYSPLLVEQGVLFGRMIALREMGASEQADPIGFVCRTALKGGKVSVVRVPHVLFYDAAPPSTPRSLNLHPASHPLPMVSVLIPTRNRWDLLGVCLDSIGRSNWPRERLEIIIIDNGSDDKATLDALEKAESQGDIRLLRDPYPFNYARLNNMAARQAQGKILILLNNDTEVIDPMWISKLVSFVMQQDVGVVGPKLLYPDRTVQHGGVVLGIQGVAAHAHLGLPKDDGGYAGLANITHEVSTLTGACMAVSREHYMAVGGLDESFRVSFNDVVFCLDLCDIGLRNIYLAEPLLIHHESKSRGYDDSSEKLTLARLEARGAWLRHARQLRSDPYYSPNLSLEHVYRIAFAPRRRPFWDRLLVRPPRVMLLSCTHARGHGVPVVLKLQAERFVECGYHVVIGGPQSEKDMEYPGCERVEVHDPRIAAVIAAERGIDVIVAHTPPFFSVARWTGDYPRVVAYDYGEPPPSLFPDSEARQAILDEKDQVLVMCDRVFAISDAIAAESRTPVSGVIPIGNVHLGRWDTSLQDRREYARAKHGWTDCFVVLNVCRFHRAERAYKGIEAFIYSRDALKIVDSDLAKRTVFVLCGKGDQGDIAAMKAEGLTVAANVSDEEIIDLYCAADAYANFSTWEGYNLGIGQALAMGLPVVASDIPAHRAFSVSVTNRPMEAASMLAGIARKKQKRAPCVWDWDASLTRFVAEVEALCPADVRPTTVRDGVSDDAPVVSECQGTR